MAVSEADERAIERQRSFVSEVFHNLSQPLTALHCSLELSLFRDQTADELRAGIATALENAACLRQRLLLLRELNQAGDPGDLSLPTDLNELLRDLREELLPLFESAGQQFELHLEAGELQVCGNRTKLMRALFYFLEYLFRYSAPGARLELRARAAEERQAEISIATCSCLPVGPSAENESYQRSCEIEIARCSFEAAGGEFGLLASGSGPSVWRATLPRLSVADSGE